MVTANVTPSLRAILQRFHSARCVLACAVQALDDHDDVVQQQTALQHGMQLLDKVYDELDRAVVAGGAA